MSTPAPVTVNLLGIVEQAEVGSEPYRVSRDGAPYVPVGDGGIVLGLRLGDSAVVPETDHAAPGVCAVGSEAAAAHALAAYACIGNPVEARSGLAAGARGVVVGKRGEGVRVIVAFAQDDLAKLRPGDALSIRACGQGSPLPLPAVTALNAAPGLLEAAGVRLQGETLAVAVRGSWPSRYVGNGIGRPAPLWSLELSVPSPLDPPGAELRLGDLVAISDLDARFNAGYRRGWLTVGVVVHGGSPMPGHGPGLTAILTGPAASFDLSIAGERHQGLTEEKLMEVANDQS